MQRFRMPGFLGLRWGRLPGVHVFLFCGFFILLSWPLLTIAESMELYWSVFVYLFGLWATMIAVIFFLSKGCRNSDAAATGAKEGPDTEC